MRGRLHAARTLESFLSVNVTRKASFWIISVVFLMINFADIFLLMDDAFARQFNELPGTFEQTNTPGHV